MTEMMTSTAKLDAMMSKIQKLLRVADDPATTEEAAASYRAKAETLMRDYRVAEEDLIAEDQFSILPISKTVTLLDGDSEFSRWYNSMWYYIAEHTGIRTVTRWKFDSTKNDYDLVATAVGYGSDLRYAEFLWNASRLVFASKLEPSVDPTLSDIDNVYNLRSAGMERNRISALMWGAPTHSNNAKVTKLYAKACEARGEDALVAGRKISAKDYRETYARSFTYAVSGRLREARDAADSVGGGLELAGRKERVDEAFYAEFPNYRPTPTTDEPAEVKPCEACAKTKHESGKCKSCRPRKVTREEMRRMDRMYYSETAKRAAAAGRSAADDVQISRTTERTRRIETETETSGPAMELEA